MRWKARILTSHAARQDEHIRSYKPKRFSFVKGTFVFVFGVMAKRQEEKDKRKGKTSQRTSKKRRRRRRRHEMRHLQK